MGERLQIILIKRNNVQPSSPTLLHGVEKGEVLNAAGKSYTISHEGKERYTALRDVMAQKVKKIFSFPSAMRGTKQSAYKEEFWALKDINFEIEQGDGVGIIGRNGALR